MKRKGVTQFSIMTSVLCPSVIRRQIDCMLVLCVCVSCTVSCSFAHVVTTNYSRRQPTLLSSGLSQKWTARTFVDCVFFPFIVWLCALFPRSFGTRIRALLSSHTRMPDMLATHYSCRMKDVTCVCVSFVRVESFNSIFENELRIVCSYSSYCWCPSNWDVVYMSCVQLVDSVLLPARFEWIKYESL